MRVRLDLAYDGTDYRGFAENVGVPTVGGELRLALERVLGAPITLTCAGRTDAGVHARGQVVTFDAPEDRVDPRRLQRSLNSMLAPRIVVHAVSVVGEDFDARFSATWRSYRYTVLHAELPDPFLARTSWWVPEALDLEVMRAGAAALVGEHDFASFCRRPTPDASLVRRVHGAGWEEVPLPGSPAAAPGGDGARLLRFGIVASSFCHQMVRSIVGTLVDAGRGRARCADLPAVIAARDRAAAGNLAPPQGLVLWEVGYPPAEPALPVAGGPATS